MSSPVSGAVRSARAALLGAVCVALALSGHILGGGRTPSLWVLVMLSVPMGVLALAVTARRHGLPVIGLTVASSQVVLHAAFMWSASGAGCAVTGDLHAHVGHAAAGPLLACTAMPGMSAVAMAGHFSVAAMLLAHAVAALVTTVLLAYGESLLWRVWDRMLRLPRAGAVPVVGSAGALTPRRTRSAARVRMLTGSIGRRGPPAPAPVVG